MKNRKSFTLIELLVVITIIAVLAAVSIPQVIGVIQRAQDAAIRMNMRVMLTEATRISILEGDLSRIHCNTGGHPDILAICGTVRAHSPHPTQVHSSATTRTFCIQTPLHDGTFWRIDHTGFAGRDLCGYVARWDMDEGSGTTVNDKSGNANHGTIHGAIWRIIDGHTFLEFVARGAHVSTVGGTGPNLPSAFSVEVWFYRQSGTFVMAHLISQRYNATHGFSLTFSGDNVFGSIGHFSPHNSPGTTGWHIHTRDRWYHVILARCSVTGIGRVWLNGVPVNMRSYHGIALNLTSPIRIMGFWGEPHAITMVRQSGLRIYDRALTAEEVRASFLRGR